MIDHEGFKRCGLKPYSDDSVLTVGLQSRALDAFVVARKWYRKSWVLNFVTFTVGTDPPRAAAAAPTLSRITYVVSTEDVKMSVSPEVVYVESRE